MLSLTTTLLSLLLTNPSPISALPQFNHPHRPPSLPGHSPSSSHPVTTTVDLGYATYHGTHLLPSNILQYLGIRFAAPPVGNLRWRAPQDAEHVDGVQAANEFQPTCLGYFGGGLSESVQEDCLFLNIFAPGNATTESKLPVWFFIQGGGYAGDTDQNFNFTEVIEKSGFGMVAVQINYRVGAFGFLASEKVREDGDLNVGLLDQRKALHWVQQYIHLFGGDPNHVVIHGDSAGAGSVAFHLTAYNGRNDHLFIGGISESPFWPTHRNVAEMEFQFERFAKNISCDPAEHEDVMSCLRSKDTATLQGSDVTSPFPGGPSTPNPAWYFLPVIDGVFSTDYLYNLFEQGKLVRVPLIVGDDTDEGTGFAVNANTSSQFLDFMDANYPHLDNASLSKISETYPEDGFGDPINHGPYFPAAAAAYGEATFVCPGIQMASSLAKYNSAAKTWNYRYNVQDKNTVAAGYGVPHVAEKPAIWGPNNAGACGDPCSYLTYNANIVPVMMSYWISFILSLDPNTHKVEQAPEWEPWTSQRDGYGGGWGGWRGGHSHGDSDVQRLVIQTNMSRMETIPSAQLSRCELWRSLAEVTEQ